MDFNYTFTGKLTPDCRGLAISFADQMGRILQPIKEEELEIYIKKFRKQRTVAQNSYLWGVVIPTVRAWMKENNGACPSAEAIYAILRIKVVGQEVIIEEIDGHDVPIISGKRFSEMNTLEFTEAVDKIILYYAEQGLEIPLPKPKSNNFINDFMHQ
jgi:hypothetical protein